MRANDSGLDPTSAAAETDPTGLSRRSLLKRAGVGAAVVWTAPVIMSSPAFAAGTPLHFWVASGTNDNFGVSSQDGVNLSWTAVASGTALSMNGIAANGQVFAAVLNTGVILRSPDGGATWSQVDNGAASGTQNLRAVATTGNTWLGVSNGGRVARSIDNAVTWAAAAPSGTGAQLNGVAGLGTTWVAVGQNELIRRSTADGVGFSWSTRPSPFPGTPTLRAVAADGTTFVTVGGGGVIGQSTDTGLTFLQRSSTTTSTLNGVDGSGSTWVAVGVGGVIVRSTDGGTTWGVPPVLSPTGQTLTAVATDGNGVWVAVGLNSTMLRSKDDGASWTTVTSPVATGDWLSVATGNAP
jgi:photosystem II stability/assembly factor-like uncharacterized protein